MKCTTILNEDREEEVLIYTHSRTELVSEIERLCSNNSLDLIGFKKKSIIKLSVSDVFCFVVEDNKIFATLDNDKILIKRRLYEIEEILDSSFVKINQSCIVNIKKIDRFDASFSGALMVTLKNGYRDYVSRRQLKFVKERIGF